MTTTPLPCEAHADFDHRPQRFGRPVPDAGSTRTGHAGGHGTGSGVPGLRGHRPGARARRHHHAGPSSGDARAEPGSPVSDRNPLRRGRRASRYAPPRRAVHGNAGAKRRDRDRAEPVRVHLRPRRSHDDCGHGREFPHDGQGGLPPRGAPRLLHGEAQATQRGEQRLAYPPVGHRCERTEPLHPRGGRRADAHRKRLDCRAPASCRSLLHCDNAHGERLQALHRLPVGAQPHRLGRGQSGRDAARPPRARRRRQPGRKPRGRQHRQPVFRARLPNPLGAGRAGERPDPAAAPRQPL